MSRFVTLAVAVSAAGLLASLPACRARARPAPANANANANAAALAPTASGAARRHADVRPIGAPAGGTVLLAEVNGRRCAFVADEEDAAVQRIDLETHAVVTTTKLEGAPGQMLLAPDGMLFVAVRGGAHVVGLRLDAAGSAHEVARHATGDEPFGLALTPDGTTLLVTSIVDPRVEAFRATDLASRYIVPLGRDPRSIAVTSDGARAFVTHATGSRLSVLDVKEGSTHDARAIALDANERRHDFGMPRISKSMMSMESLDDPWGRGDGASRKHALVEPRAVRVSFRRSATQGFGLAMLGGDVLLPETLVMTSDGEQTAPSGYGSIAQSTLSTHVPFVARVEIATEKLANQNFSGPADRECFERRTECIVPRAVASDGKVLFVACLDSNEVLAIDPAQDAEHHPACLTTSKARRRLVVESPTGVAVDATRGSVVAFSIFTRRLSELPLAGGAAVELTLPAASRETLTELAAEGRRLFHRSADERIARNGRACASCHVDGREDGLVWPTPKGKRQTPMLAGRLEGTAPYGWNGEHDTLVAHIESTVKNLGGTGLAKEQLAALAEYVASMKAPARQRSTGGGEAAALLARGRAVFDSNETGCSSCHVAESRFTDHETHAFTSPRDLFDTPSLAFVAQTAPYFHDGRFATLEALIAACDDPKVKMGHTSHLGDDDRRALAAYLRSL